MTIYKGSQKIKEIGEHGIYFGNQPINAVYKGSKLVYQYQPYAPSQILLQQSTAGTYTISLKRGVYFFDLTGGGGGASGAFFYQCHVNTGGSGGTCKGNLYVKSNCTIKVVVGNGKGGYGEDSVIYVNDVEIMRSRGGHHCHADNNCGDKVGGTATLSLGNSSLIQNIDMQAVQGNPGRYSTGGYTEGGFSNDAISPYWGKGAATTDCNANAGNAGGTQIKYLRPFI